MKKVAILYDFDKTLCTKDMQEYSMIPALGYTDPKEFWTEVMELSRDNKMDSISAYLYMLQKKFAEQGRPLQRARTQRAAGPPARARGWPHPPGERAGGDGTGCGRAARAPAACPGSLNTS